VKRFAAVLLLIGLAACQASEVETGRERYASVWNARLDGYRQEFVRQDQEIRRKDKAAGEALGRLADLRWSDFISPVMDTAADVRETFKIAGRGETLKRFIAHMQTMPTPGLTDIWFRDEVENLQREARRIDDETGAFFASFERRATLSPDWIKDIETLARAQGVLLGTAEELQSLLPQALAYHGDMLDAAAADRVRARQQAEQQRRAATVLLGAAAVLERANYQQRMIGALSRPRKCASYGGKVVCD
jgi:hypothetical protein